MSTPATALTDQIKIANKAFSSRLIIGTGKYRSHDEMKAAHRASSAEMVTVAVRRVPLDRSSESFLDHLDPSLQILPNTAGCYSAEEAVRTARLAREALETVWIKLEVIGDQTTLFPDNEQTLDAGARLPKEGFPGLPPSPPICFFARNPLPPGVPPRSLWPRPLASARGSTDPP